MTDPQIQPEEVYALVVGIEKYKGGSEWDLKGPANDAIKFTKWLRERGVKPDNIFLFISPLEDNKDLLQDLLQKTEVKSKPASRDEIDNAIRDNLTKEDAAGGLLYIFWGGHGFIAPFKQNERILLFGDTNLKNYKNLDFYSLQEALKTSFEHKGFARQVYLVDACANLVSNEHFEIASWAKEGQHFSPKSNQQPHEQFILFAAAEYEVAINDTTKKTGSFSNAIWNELNQLPLDCLLPDMDKLASDIKTALKAEGKPQPTKLYFRDWDGRNQGFESFGFRQFDWREFFREMTLEDRESASTNRLTSIAGIAPRVKDIYVRLGLVEREKQSKRQNDVSPQQGSELYKEIEITKQFEHNEFLKEVLKQKNSPKSQGKRIAIIGEPGAGKTTLLQRIADWVYNKIEESVVIWVSLADLQGQELETYLYEKWPTAAARKKGKAEAPDKLQDDFATEFTKGRVWLLLDGLDEMSLVSGNPLSEIARQIREGGSISQARIVLTCRVNLWDGSSNVLNEFDTYRTLDFSYPQQVKRFIGKWFGSQAQEEQGQRLFHALNEPGKERIRDLVKNPLRLTLLCLDWGLNKEKLPETKAKLYEQFVTDLYELKKEEFPTSYEEHEQLKARLAKLSREAIDKEKNRFLLRYEFVCRFLGHPNEKGSSFDLALKLGWLNKVGLDAKNPREAVYAFFHATFQEYFAARAINEWDFFLPSEHIDRPVVEDNAGEYKPYRIFEPQWKEVILLWLGREDEKLREQKEKLIGALVEFDSGCGNFYERRAYFLAAVGIAEFKDCSRADEIVEQIVEWGFGSFNIEEQKWVRCVEPSITEEARAVLLETERTKAINALVELIQNPQSEDIHWQAVASLGEIGSGNPTAIHALESLVQNSQSKDPCRNAVWSLGKIGSGNLTAINALVELIQNSQSEDTCRLAAECLGKIGSGNLTAINALLELIQNSQSEDTCRLAAECLGRIDSGNLTAINALVELTQNSQSEDTCRDAVWSLGRIGSGNLTAINALVELIQNSQSEDIRTQAVFSLQFIGSGNLTAINALFELIQNSQDKCILGFTVRSLIKIGLGNPTAIHALESLTQNSQSEDRRWRAAASLGKIDSGNPTAIHALESLIQNSQSEDIHWQAVASLGEIGSGNPTAINALESLIQNSQSEDRRMQAAESLLFIDSGNPTAIHALESLIQNSQSEDTCRLAAASLGKIDSGNPTAIHALVELLIQNSQHEFTRMQAVQSLEKIDSGNPTVINTLVELLIQNYQSEDIPRKAARLLDIPREAARLLKKILGEAQMEGVITVLKDYLSNETYENDYERYKCGYEIVWHCAQTLPYPTFYQAWHRSPNPSFVILGKLLLFLNPKTLVKRAIAPLFSKKN